MPDRTELRAKGCGRADVLAIPPKPIIWTPCPKCAQGAPNNQPADKERHDG